jgi:hypothetical protein
VEERGGERDIEWPGVVDEDGFLYSLGSEVL